MVSIINYSFAEGKWGDTVENADQITPLLLVIKINAYLYKYLCHYNTQNVLTL